MPSPWPAYLRVRSADANLLAAHQRAVDPPGVRLHLGAAVVACLLAGWPTTFVAWAIVPLAVVFTVRMWSHHPILQPLWREPAAWLVLAWSAWLILSMFWTLDRAAGLDELGVLPFGLLVVMLYPVMDRRGVLIGAIVIGIACGQVTQAMHAVGGWLEWPALMWNRLPGRNSGWWDPVVGGSVLCAALGLHLAGLLFARSARQRLLGGAGAALTVLSLMLTGTRGAWLGAAGLILITLALALAQRARHGLARPRASESPGEQRGRTRGLQNLAKIASIGIALTMLAALAVWWSSSTVSGLLGRAGAGIREARAAMNDGDYTSDTGRRVAMAQWAVAAAACKPLTGVGAGGFQPWVRQQAALHATAVNDSSLSTTRSARPCAARGPLDGGGADVHRHAHSWLLQVVATTGLPGVLLTFALLGACIGPGIVRVWRGEDRGYATGPVLALVGLFGAGIFDAISVNQQTWYLAMLLVALLVRQRPAQHGGFGAGGLA